MNYLKEHWGTLSLMFASVAPFAGWCACGNLPAVSCVPVAVTAVCGVALGILELCGIAEDVRRIGEDE